MGFLGVDWGNVWDSITGNGGFTTGQATVTMTPAPPAQPQSVAASGTSSRPSVLLPGVEWDPTTRKASGMPNASSFSPINPTNWSAPLPETITQALTNRGWNIQLPAKPKTAELPETWWDKQSEIKLTDYDYKIADAEWSRMKEAYGVTNETDEAPTVRSKNVSAVKMTREAYDQLSDEQRAAVDFNTLLVEAREKDLKEPKLLSGSDREDYDKRVHALFGEQGASEKSGVHTLELLEKLLKENSSGKIMSTMVGQDFDDFLSLESAVDFDDLAGLKMPPLPIVRAAEFTPQKAPRRIGGRPGLRGRPTPAAPANEFVRARGEANRDLARDLVIRNLNTRILSGLTDARVQASSRSGVRNILFGLDPQVELGFAPPNSEAAASRTEAERQKEEQWQNFYAYGLRNREATDLTPLWVKINEAGWSESDIDEFWAYIDKFTRYAERTGLGGADNKYRSAADVRKLAGLEP